MTSSPRLFIDRLLLLGVLGILYAPVLMIILGSFAQSRLGIIGRGFTTAWYLELFRDGELLRGLTCSAIIGFAASTMSVGLGAMAALGLSAWRPRPRRLVQGVLGLPIVVPDMILAVALAIFFHALGTEKGWLTVVLAHTAFGLAYAFVVISAAVRDLNPDLLAAALDCGASPWQAFWRVLAPILMPSLIVAWLLVFALSFDDYLIAFFTKGPATDTLPIKIFGRMRRGVTPDTNALFALLFAATLAGALVAQRLQRRRGKD